ncbi:MAG: hypothetical protein ABIZ50_01130 [Solirubrobacterales bacterium]
MASKKKIAGKAAKAKAGSAADTARPYVQRLIDDDDLRDNLRRAYDSAQDAYGRASGAKRPSDVLEDKKLQKDLRTASESLRAASEALREPEKSGGSALGKLLFVAIIGAVLALALSEDLRKKVLDQLFGAEEEFEYTSTTSTSSADQTASTA